MAVEALPFTILLGHSNSAFNPLLYCAMNYHLHRRRRSQSQTPAPAGVAESKRPLKMAVAETGARAWHCRPAPQGKSSVIRNSPALCEGQPASDVHKQNGLESSGQVKLKYDRGMSTQISLVLLFRQINRHYLVPISVCYYCCQ
jgi:hypothetical protein